MHLRVVVGPHVGRGVVRVVVVRRVDGQVRQALDGQRRIERSAHVVYVDLLQSSTRRLIPLFLQMIVPIDVSFSSGVRSNSVYQIFEILKLFPLPLRIPNPLRVTHHHEVVNVRAAVFVDPGCHLAVVAFVCLGEATGHLCILCGSLLLLWHQSSQEVIKFLLIVFRPFVGVGIPNRTWRLHILLQD